MIKIYDRKEISIDEILERSKQTIDVEGIVQDIIKNVKENGDKALVEYCKKFDGAKDDVIEVTAEEIDEAIKEVDDELLNILREAKENITAFHSKQVRNSFVINDKEGVIIGQKVIPIEKVGLYVPGGTASYPSSVLMNCVPAKIAGCSEIVMVTPAKEGKVKPVILAAAKIAGVDRVFKIGGAQAVAALAYGTESVPKVDKIVGPGNAFVAEAKKQVFGMVDIDMIAGPSEILVVADSTNNPAHIAADLLSQAEHDKMATAVLITDSMAFAENVSAELEKQIPLLPREEIARCSIDTNGKIIVTDNLVEAMDVSNILAPEHLEIQVDNPMQYLGRLDNAGSIFMGQYSPKPLSDYFAGPNHVLPTSGTARFFSPLSVNSFTKRSSFIYYTEQALMDAKDDIVCIAEKEGLTAHANAIKVRF